MPNTRPILLQAHSLTRTISPSARVADVSLTLRQGDVLGLLGLNGAGKSTTLKMLAGILVPDAGDIAIGGESLIDQPLKARAQLGYLPDTPPLFPDMRVASYLKLAAQLRRVPKAQLTPSLEYAIERCDLAAVANQRIASLSKGFRQRVGLAQAIIHRPKLILLDEPSNGLDPHQMQGMRALIRKLGEEAAVIFSTHLLPEAIATCNHIAVMHNGRIVASELPMPIGVEDLIPASASDSPSNSNSNSNSNANANANANDDSDEPHSSNTTPTLKREELDTLFANLVQFGTPKAPIKTLTNKSPAPSASDAIDA